MGSGLLQLVIEIAFQPFEGLRQVCAPAADTKMLAAIEELGARQQHHTLSLNQIDAELLSAGLEFDARKSNRPGGCPLPVKQ